MLCESWKLIYNLEAGTSFQGRDVPPATWACVRLPHGSCLVGADLEVSRATPLEMLCSRVPHPLSLGDNRKQQRPGWGKGRGTHSFTSACTLAA